MAMHLQRFLHVGIPICGSSNAPWLKNIGKACSSCAALGKYVDRPNSLFSSEQKRQFEEIGRIEKISVAVSGPPEDTLLHMNKDVSTPFDCARHISKELSKRAGMALVDSSTLWDMHRPLERSCSLNFLHFNDDDPHLLNQAFWESCSIVLGSVIANAFKDDVSVVLHSYPTPDIRSGSFVYDVKMSLDRWKPTGDELRVLTAEMVSFIRGNHKFERLSVTKDVALEIMQENPSKQEQINAAASESNGGKVTLYRVGGHVDLCENPLIGNTSSIGRCTITAVHHLQTPIGPIYRFQGVALPSEFVVNHFAYSILEQRAMKLNPAPYPRSK